MRNETENTDTDKQKRRHGLKLQFPMNAKVRLRNKATPARSLLGLLVLLPNGKHQMIQNFLQESAPGQLRECRLLISGTYRGKFCRDTAKSGAMLSCVVAGVMATYSKCHSKVCSQKDSVYPAGLIRYLFRQGHPRRVRARRFPSLSVPRLI